MANHFEVLRKAVIDRAVRGPGTTPPAEREAAFANTSGVPLLEKVAQNAWKVTDDDVATSGRPDDAVFELVICAALGQASRQLESARAALAAATKVPA